MSLILSTTRRMYLLGGLAAASMLVAAGFAAGPAAAADYPDDDITIIVPYAPGASADLLVREYAELLGKELGVTIVVRNMPGGSGTIGTVQIFTARPDGYTIGYGHNSPLAIQPHKNADLPYKSGEDFTTIGGLGHQSGTVSVNSASEYKTFADFVAAAKAAPNEISIAVGAAGNVKDMQLQQFEKAAGVEFNITPFSGGGAEAVAAVLGQHVDAVSVNASSVAGQIESGDLRPLAIFADSDAEEIKGFEVISAADYPGMQFLQDSSGIIGPPGLSDEVVEVLSAAHQKVMQDEGFLASLEAGDYLVDPADPAEYRAQLMSDYANFGEILGK